MVRVTPVVKIAAQPLAPALARRASERENRPKEKPPAFRFTTTAKAVVPFRRHSSRRVAP